MPDNNKNKMVCPNCQRVIDLNPSLPASPPCFFFTFMFYVFIMVMITIVVMIIWSEWPDLIIIIMRGVGSG